jgi:hypothetical protein
MSSLRSLLADLRAAPEIQQALASGTHIEGKPIADHIAAMEAMIDHLEHSPDDAAIEAHDRMLKIVVDSGASLKERLEAIAGCKRCWTAGDDRDHHFRIACPLSASLTPVVKIAQTLLALPAQSGLIMVEQSIFDRQGHVICSQCQGLMRSLDVAPIEARFQCDNPLCNHVVAVTWPKWYSDPPPYVRLRPAAI